MRKLKIVLLILALFFTTNCGIKDAMKNISNSVDDIAASIKKVTDAATTLLNKITDISQLVDSKLESGEITQGVADMVDGRLQTVSQVLEGMIQNSGGYIFDRIDGSVDNAFSELGKLLDDLAAGVLGNYVPSLINQISEQMTLQINTITSSIEDLLVVTAGQTIYVVDKTFSGLVVTISIILLAIGLIILAIILLRKGRKLNAANFIGVGLIGVFMIFLLILIFSPTVRGKLISGFDYGAALKVKEITPKITAVVPQNIILGKTNRIYIYGSHLNKLEKIAVRLTQGTSEKFTFPPNTMIVNTNCRIVLGNLDRELQWTVPLYATLHAYMASNVVTANIPEERMTQFSRSLNEALYPEIKYIAPVPVMPPAHVVADHHVLTEIAPIRNMEIKAAFRIGEVTNTYPRQLRKKDFNVLRNEKNSLAMNTIGAANYSLYLAQLSSFFMQRFKLAEGDYGLKVFADTTLIESPQFITVNNPPPPVPQPDIFIMDMNWTGGILPMARKSATLDITFGFSHPEQIHHTFNAKIITVPATTPISVTVPEGKIAAAASGNRVVVTTNQFTIDTHGTYGFNCSVDDQNEIPESNEANNTFSKNLMVGEYVYDVTLNNFSFEALPAYPFTMDGKLTYSMFVDAGTNPTSKCNSIATVKKNTTTPLNCNFSTPELKEGETVMLTFIPVIEVKIAFLTFSFSPGNVVWQHYLDVNPTGLSDTKQYDILRETNTYKLHGKMTITRRASL